MNVKEIKLELNDADQLLISRHSLFYGKRKLSRDAEEFLIEEANLCSSKDHIHLMILLNKDGINRKDEIATAIPDHFNYRRKNSERQLRRIFQLGWRSLLISIGFFSLLISFIPVIAKLLPEGGLSITFREILIILGWVALWRPADFLLYEWRPFKREIDVFRKLEESKVEIVIGKE